MAEGGSRGDGGGLRLPFLFVPHGDPLPLAWMAEHPGWVRVPATFVPREPPRPAPGERRHVRPRPDAAPALSDDRNPPPRAVAPGLHRARPPSTLPNPPATAAGADPVARWRDLMAEAADQMARHAPSARGTGATNQSGGGQDARTTVASHAPQLDPDATPHVPETGRAVRGGEATDPPHATAQDPHTDARADLRDLKDSSEAAAGSGNGGLWTYLRSSADAFKDVARDVGDLLSDPSQIPDALSSVLPGIVPAAGELPQAVQGGLGALRALGNMGKTEPSPATPDDTSRTGKSTQYDLTKTVQDNVPTRPYINSPLVIQEIGATGKGIPDPGGISGAVRYSVSGTRTRPNVEVGAKDVTAHGTYELVIDLKTNKIYHFLFRSDK